MVSINIARHLAKTTAELSKKLGLGSGTTIGGRVAAFFDTDILSGLCENVRVALVSGTNGKTTTARFLTEMFRKAGLRTVTNTGGSNMVYGIIFALLKERNYEAAVLEIDELWLAKLIFQIKPELVILTNLTRDQLDRATEVRAVASRLNLAFLNYARDKAFSVVANSDDPMVVYALDNLESKSEVLYVSAGNNWHLDSYSCPRCAGLIKFENKKFNCLKCGLSNPNATADICGDVLNLKNDCVKLESNLPGEFNKKNLALATIGATVFGINPKVAIQAVKDLQDVYGRFKVFKINNLGFIELVLVKNPAGFNEALKLVESDSVAIVGLNAEIPDGKDTSWIWDVNFSPLHNKKVIVTGLRAYDLALVLSYQDVEFEIVRDLKRALYQGTQFQKAPVKALLNYSLFNQALKVLGDEH